MIKNIEYSKIDEGFLDNYVLIDVRSPKEFADETIPGAVNLPIFTDEQRELIGTIYVNESIEKAKRIGVEAASANLPLIYEKVEELRKKYKNLAFFCARGGMRSSSLVSLLSSLGLNALKIKGGYKGYRAYVNEQLPKVVEDVKFIVLHGNTGVGKTKILKKLSQHGYDMLDLEGCANHRGSLLGSVGLGRENSQKQFESLIYDNLKNRNTNIVLVEAESKRIGRKIIPECIYKSMGNGVHVNIKLDLDLRVENILEDYVSEDNEELINALNKLRKYINDTRIDNYINLVSNSEYIPVIKELMVKYYDPMYENKKVKYELNIEDKNMDEIFSEIAVWVDKNFSDNVNIAL